MELLKRLRTNWKTTLVGLITIIITLLVSKGKLDIATGTAITSGVTLIFASDP